MATTPLSAPDGTLRTGNLFLDALPAEASEALHKHLSPADMPARFSCTDSGARVQSVYFPISSVVSVVARMKEGDAHEVGMIGRDGAVGGLEVLFDGPSLYESFVQIGGSGLAIDAAEFEAVLAHNVPLRDALLRFAQATLGIAEQSAACNGTHAVNERCARWLLTAHDRVTGSSIDITHEFLGQMLNVRRAGVTNAAIALQQTGAISYKRGRIMIENRRVLESLACECYATSNDNATLVLGYGRPSPRLGARGGFGTVGRDVRARIHRSRAHHVGCRVEGRRTIERAPAPVAAAARFVVLE